MEAPLVGTEVQQPFLDERVKQEGVLQCYPMENALGMSNRPSGIMGGMIASSEGILEVSCSRPTSPMKRPRRLHPFVLPTQLRRCLVALM